MDEACQYTHIWVTFGQPRSGSEREKEREREREREDSQFLVIIPSIVGFRQEAETTETQREKENVCEKEKEE